MRRKTRPRTEPEEAILEEEEDVVFTTVRAPIEEEGERDTFALEQAAKRKTARSKGKARTGQRRARAPTLKSKLLKDLRKRRTELKRKLRATERDIKSLQCKRK